MEGFNVAGIDLFDQAVLAIKDLTVVGRTVGRRLPMDQNFVIKKVGIG